MTRGLLAPLSPSEEIALRRIAHGSIAVDAQAMARLASLALVERVHTSLQLTPLGRLRFNSLPKAPLLARQRSIFASDYVADVIEKAQGSANRRLATWAPAPPVGKGPMPRSVAMNDDDAGCTPLRQFISFSDLLHWQSRAERNIEKTRRIMIEHRRHQERRCDDSRRCIAISRSLLAATVPITPAWLGALKAPEA